MSRMDWTIALDEDDRHDEDADYAHDRAGSED